MNEEQSRSLGRIEAKQDMILDKINEHLEEDMRVHADQENRLRSLEQTRWRTHGFTAGIAAFVSTGVALFMKYKGGM